MPCRVGITTNPVNLKADWETKVVQLTAKKRPGNTKTATLKGMTARHRIAGLRLMVRGMSIGLSI
ncbi:MAG: hypothetical protein O2887_03735 [Bacteroidetes bacterium]|nr:hypothetical protein [Bacteroidota bacterium]MDA1119597.1 hypothetical protein [Bacteroidota bacterium]